ncbi:MAG: murein biosynthesis integral membrane protein MurJ, partial [Ghiorsea sp.]|nr:murein biosynthesis integral membrane protein MurJ [Ghiorsea sp.]
RMFSAALACLPMATWLYYAPHLWAFPSDKLMQFIWLTALVIGSMLTFFAAAWVLGERKLLKQ